MELSNTIGNTPLLDFSYLYKKWNRAESLVSESTLFASYEDSPNPLYHSSVPISLLAKCEYVNPTGSIKDRIADYIIKKAESSGQLKPGDTLIESTSGNTGAAVAMIAAMKGYRAVLVIPDRVSEEKQKVLRALGATVEVMPSEVSIDSEHHYTVRAKALSNIIPNSFYVNQYNNLENTATHYHTTGPEIWQQTQGKIDVFIAVAGSGGTISGVGHYLKSKNPKIKVIGVDPVGSVYYPLFKNNHILNRKDYTPSLVEGAGSDHLSAVMDFTVVDQMIQFNDQNAFDTARFFAKETGILVGGSSGANIWAAMRIAKKSRKPLRIVTLLTDSGLKYLSKFYDDNWMKIKQLIGKRAPIK